jgi:hypothetical protein
LAVWVGSNAVLTAEVRSGRAIVQRQVTWESAASSVASVDPNGLVTGESEGETLIIASVGKASDSITVSVQDSPIGPQPLVGNRVLVDFRAGGNRDLQAALSEAEAKSFIDDFNGTQAKVGFTTDFDGEGAHAFVVNWPGWGENARDISVDLGIHLPAYETELWVSYKSWWGRTPTGGGIGDIGAFDPTNEHDPVGNAGGKRFRCVGDGWAGGEGEASVVMAGPEPWRPRGVGSAFPRDHSGKRTFEDQELVGRVVTYVYHIRVSSGPGVKDGVFEQWINGDQMFDAHDIEVDIKNVKRFKQPTVMRSPKYDMTEYIWDIVAWSP